MLTSEIAPHAIVESIKTKHYPILFDDYYLKLALLYAEKGYKVFPVNPNKIPYRGFAWSKEATSDFKKIKVMWKIYPNGRPAFYCKESDVLVIDTDNKPQKDKFGFETLKKLTQKLGPLPKTVLVYTQSNGTHMYFKLPKDRVFKRKISNCIDIQTNHYCLCGGVYTENSSYRFAKGYTFEEIRELPSLPIEWINFLSKEQVAPKQLNVYKSASVKKELIDGDFRILYNNCAFCRYCADNAYALDENSWFKFAVILSDLKDGFNIFDYYSKPYPEYSYQETLDKFNNAKKYSMSCKTVATDFEGCKNCENYKEENNYVY